MEMINANATNRIKKQRNVVEKDYGKSYDEPIREESEDEHIEQEDVSVFPRTDKEKGAMCRSSSSVIQ